jgi:GTP-binding protein HflX
VVDASSEEQAQQMEVVFEVLNQLGVSNTPILTVYNKCDILGDFIQGKDSVSVSAKTGMGIEYLKEAVAQKLAEMRSELSVLLPLDAGALVSRIYANGQVTGCEYLAGGIKLTAVVTIEDASRLRAAALEVYY